MTPDVQSYAVPAWLKKNSLYPRVRAAALSLSGNPRFYGPIKAAYLCPGSREQEREAALSSSIQKISADHGLALWNTPIGELATADTELAAHVGFLVAEYERDVYLSGTVSVKPGSTVLDVGGNIGLFSMRALSAKAKRIIAVEPTPGNIQAFRQNLANGIEDGRVNLVEKGAWDATAQLKFAIDPAHPARNSCVEPVDGTTTLTIQAAPLDSILQELGSPKIDFVKMDIEGAEINALKGAAHLLRTSKPQLAIAVEHTSDWLANAAAVRDLVLGINPGYQCTAGPFMITKKLRLAPEVLYFD